MRTDSSSALTKSLLYIVRYKRISISVFLFKKRAVHVQKYTVLHIQVSELKFPSGTPPFQKKRKEIHQLQPHNTVLGRSISSPKRIQTRLDDFSPSMLLPNSTKLFSTKDISRSREDTVCCAALKTVPQCTGIFCFDMVTMETKTSRQRCSLSNRSRIRKRISFADIHWGRVHGVQPAIDSGLSRRAKNADYPIYPQGWLLWSPASFTPFICKAETFVNLIDAIRSDSNCIQIQGSIVRRTSGAAGRGKYDM